MWSTLPFIGKSILATSLSALFENFVLSADEAQVKLTLIMKQKINKEESLFAEYMVIKLLR